MRRDVIANKLIGIMIIFLPYWTKLASINVRRSSKAELLSLFFVFLLFLLRDKKRELSQGLWLSVLLIAPLLIFNEPSVSGNFIYTIVSMAGILVSKIYIAIGLCFFLSFTESCDTESSDFILNCLMVGCISQCVLAFLQYVDFRIYTFILELIGSKSITLATLLPSGSFDNPNIFSAYVSITCVSFFNKEKMHLLPLPLLAMYLSGSIMGIATVAATFLYLLGSWRVKNTVWLMGTAIVYFVFIFLEPWGIGSNRDLLYLTILKKFDLWHFLIGKGAGWLSLANLPLGTSRIGESHNFLITAVNHFGLVGLGSVLYIFKKALDGNSIFSIIAFAVFFNSLGHFTFNHAATALVSIVCISLAIAYRGNDGKLEW